MRVLYVMLSAICHSRSSLDAIFDTGTTLVWKRGPVGNINYNSPFWVEDSSIRGYLKRAFRFWVFKTQIGFSGVTDVSVRSPRMLNSRSFKQDIFIGFARQTLIHPVMTKITEHCVFLLTTTNQHVKRQVTWWDDVICILDYHHVRKLNWITLFNAVQRRYYNSPI